MVENHVRSLLGCDEVERVVLVSGPRQGGLSAETIRLVDRLTIDDFDYDDLGERKRETKESQDQILTARRDRMLSDLSSQLLKLGVTRESSVLHWHNHSLGKNTAGPAVVHQLAEQGWRLLLQIHDFAEDYRPENYRRLVEAIDAKRKSDVDSYLYPRASNIHYATLTQADAEALRELGVPESCTHCLPNGVVIPSDDLATREVARSKVVKAFSLPSNARWCLYPVRGIRRKNVGELLLLSRWVDEEMYVGLTLRPATPIEARSYDRWKEIASQFSPRLKFDVGQHPDLSYSENLSAAEFVVSTSVAEGFGMAFLEPWLVGREVIARRLPGVADDFAAAGLDLSKFYDSIPIPGKQSWIEDCERETRSAELQAWEQVPKAFRPVSTRSVGVETDVIDFARLTPVRQIEVLSRLQRDKGFEAEVKGRSRDLVLHLARESNAVANVDALINRNANVVRANYSPECTTERLMTTYKILKCSERSLGNSSHPIAEVGIDVISAVRPYYPCRTEVCA